MQQTELNSITSTPSRNLAAWLGVFVLFIVLGAAGAVLFSSSIVVWAAIGLVAAVVAFAAAGFGPTITGRSRSFIAVLGVFLLPTLIGYFAWRNPSSETGVSIVQWLLRVVVFVIIAATLGSLIRSGEHVQTASLKPRGPLMQLLNAYRLAADTLSGYLGGISAALVFPTVAISVANVVLRRVGASMGRNLTTNGLIEAQWYLYGLIFITGLAYILRDGINVRVDFWFGERSPKVQSWIDTVGHIIGLLPFAYIGIKYSWPSVSRSWAYGETSPDPGGLYRPPIKTALMAAFIFIAIAGVADLIKNIEYLRGHESRRADEAPALAGGQTYSVDEFAVDGVDAAKLGST